MGDDAKEKKKKAKKKTEEAPAAEAPAAEAPAAAPARSSTKGSTKKARRTGSNVFAMFTQHQVQEYKEAFQLIDQDKDGFVSKNDIRATFDSLGRLCTEKELDDMVSEAPGPINFTMFLTIFGDRVSGVDEEDVILNAFAMYDEGDGTCSEEMFRKALAFGSEKLTPDEIEDAMAEAPISNGKIDLKKFAKHLCGAAEEEGEGA